MAAQLPSGLSGRLVALIAHTAQGSGQLAIQPGTALQVGEIPDQPRLPALVHDCASGPGSAGAPVIDLDTGYVLGVHTHAKQGDGGFAQPAWELARDPYIWLYRIRFRPDPQPSWLAAWDAPGSTPSPAPAAPSPAPKPAAPPTPNPEHWTVDWPPPIDWSRPEPQQLERLLVAAVPGTYALYLAENVGLPLGMVNTNAPQAIMWRDLLKTASTAGLLRRLLEVVATQPNFAGITPELRRYL